MNFRNYQDLSVKHNNLLPYEKIQDFSEIHTWFFKHKPKKEQDDKLLMAQIREAGSAICSISPVMIQPQYLKKRHKDSIASCPLCGEAYPLDHGRICRADRASRRTCWGPKPRP